MKTVLNEMLAAIELKRQTEQERIFAQARQEAAQLIAQSHRKARERMREWVAGERRQMTLNLQNVRAQEETEQRNHAMNVANRYLEQARQQLDQALLERWQDPAGRLAWIRALMERALVILPGGEWEIRHPADLDATHWIAPIVQRIIAAGLPAPRTKAEEALRAGLRFGCRGAWLDGSIAGLMANRLAIDAALLALMQNQGVSS